MKRNDDESDNHPVLVVGSWFAESFVVGHNAFQFRVDCGGTGKEEAQTVYFRVIADPGNAKELFRQLGRSLLRYADAYGPIDAGDRGSRSKS